MYDNLSIRDGHMHTPFCPHGTKDTLESYIEKAIKEGRREITFTEHFPMPEGVTTEIFRRACTLLEEEIPAYIEAIGRVKVNYKERIAIHLGFEVDYIEGYENKITDTLNQYATTIEDGVLSVHFVKFENQYYAIDYLPDFETLLTKIQSLEKIYDLYFETVLKSIEADLGKYKPKRIGHPTLVRIFNKKYPIAYENECLFQAIVTALKEKKYEIDFNMAGLKKGFCKETYPSGRLLELIKKEHLPLILGSDAHCAEQVKIYLSSF